MCNTHTLASVLFMMNRIGLRHMFAGIYKYIGVLKIYQIENRVFQYIIYYHRELVKQISKYTYVYYLISWPQHYYKYNNL